MYKTPLGIGDFFIDKQGFTYGLLEENPIPHNEEHQYKRNKSIDNEKIRYDVIKTAFIGANFENNKSSMRALEKNGFYLEGVRRKSVFKNEVLMDDYIWVRLRPY